MTADYGLDGRRSYHLSRGVDKVLASLIDHAAPSQSPDRRKRRSLGAFYTPPDLASALVEWSLGAGGQRILDPSVGGGVFLDAALLSEHVAESGGLEIFGIEVDDRAVELLRERLVKHLPPGRIVDGDFFQQSVDSLGSFDAVVGNPPYVRHHALLETTRSKARERMAEFGYSLSDQSDLWAYFVLYALTFLKPSGRLAFVLPGSALQADYAREVWASVSALSGMSELIRIQKTMFAGVQERSIILLVDLASRDGELSYREVADVEALKVLLTMDEAPRPVEVHKGTDRLARLSGVVEADALDVMTGAQEHDRTARLGDVCTIRIGTVTGANGFFVRTAAEAHALLEGGAGKACAIVARGAWLDGPVWTDAHVSDMVTERGWLLVVPKDGALSPSMRAAIEGAERAKLHERSHCRRRGPEWWVLRDLLVPDMFLPYMGSRPPRIAVNRAHSMCTNAIHRLYLKEGLTLDPALLALSSRTSLYDLSAELVGRQYAGGVLKMEMADAAALTIVTGVLEGECKREFEVAVAKGQSREEWAALADRVVLRQLLGFSSGDVKSLRTAAEALRKRRTG